MIRGAYIPPQVIAEVLRRSHSECEQCARSEASGVPLEMAHLVGKGMGGRHNDAEARVNSAANIRHLCYICHRQLLHHEKVVWFADTDQAQGCFNCWLMSNCESVARQRGILPPLDLDGT